MEDKVLIAEDLMLLLLDDDSGSIGSTGVYYPLGAAILSELALTGRVRPDHSRTRVDGAEILVFDGELFPDPLLQAGFETVTRRTSGVQSLLADLGASAYQPTLDRLRDRGLLRHVSRGCTRSGRKNFSAMLRTPSFAVVDRHYREDLFRRIRSVLEEGAPTDHHLGEVIGLLSASGSLYSLYPAITWSNVVIERAQALEKNSWVASAVHEVISRPNTTRIR